MSIDEFQNADDPCDEEPRPESDDDPIQPPSEALSWHETAYVKYFRKELEGLDAVLKYLLGETGRASCYMTLAEGGPGQIRIEETVQPLMSAEAYGRYGIVPPLVPGDASTVAHRRVWVAGCVEACHVALQSVDPGYYGVHDAPFNRFQAIWKSVISREQLDFGENVTLEALALLADVKDHVVYHSLRDNGIDHNGRDIPVNVARHWLSGQRRFYHSRWNDPLDDQAPYN